MTVRRYYIVENDLTAADGIVQKHTGEGSTTSWHGRVVSNIGDKVACPACKSVGIIKAVGARLPFGNKGYTPAMNDDICICKCSPPPKLVHSQKVFFQDTDDSSASLQESYNQLVSSISQVRKSFMLSIQLLDKNERPYKNKSFFAVNSNGEIHEGITNNDGITSPIYTDDEEDFTFHLIDHLQLDEGSL